MTARKRNPPGGAGSLDVHTRENAVQVKHTAPPAPQSKLAHIPAELRELPQWVAADSNKRPINPRTGQLASVNDPGSWSTFQRACAAGLPHVGFVLSEDDPYCIIDLDDKPEKPATEEERKLHQRILASFPSYTERSSSGRGYHVVLRGQLEKGHRRGSVEVYSAQRYMICTGQVVNDAPVMDCSPMLKQLVSQMSAGGSSELVHDGDMTDSDKIVHERASSATNGEKYRALWAGRWQDLGYPSQSEADHALLSILCFYSPNNEQVRRLFRDSALGKRAKAQRDAYLNGSISAIRAATRERGDTRQQKADVANWSPSVESGGKGAHPITSEARDGVQLVDLTTIKPEPIRWVWPGWLARGKLHVLAGAPGTGKTTLAMDWAACISSGRALPGCWRQKPGRVLIWSGEDDIKDTLVPRLLAAGADLGRVQAIGEVVDAGQRRNFDPGNDVHKLAAVLAGMDDVALIVVDPLVNAVAGDSHKNAEVRRALQPLVELAVKKDAVLLGITHYSKGTQGREPLERVTGSLAFGALARVVLGTVRMPQGDDASPRHMMVARCKSNIGPDGGGYTYNFEQKELSDYGVTASFIEYGKAVEGNARDLLAEDNPDDAPHDASDFLRDLLQEGSRPAKEVFREASAAGFSRDAMHRAKRRIGAVTIKEGGHFGDSEQRWVWKLAEDGRS